jgi:uncharacterized membrane protein
MRIKLTNSGITFWSLVKLFSIGYLVAMGILLVAVFVVLIYFKQHDIPTYAWFMFPIMIAAQSVFTAVLVAIGVKLYGKVNKFEILCETELQQAGAPDRQ